MKNCIALLYMVAGISLSATAQTKTDTCVVYFASNSAGLDALATARIAQWMKTLEGAKANGTFAIAGHTDATGDPAYNQLLSEKRVQVVKTCLQAQGVADSAFTFLKGYGEGLPVASDATPDNRRLNRRVELTWTGSSAPLVEQTPPAAEPPQPIAPEPPQPDTPAVKNEVMQPQPVFTEDAIRKAAKKGKTLLLKNILFEGGTERLLPQSIPDLNALLAMMEQYPRLKIEIQGHVCCGYPRTTAVEGDLSYRRAEAVRNYLIAHGIKANRLRYKGFAATRLLVDPEVTEDDRAANRRVEIKILRR